MSIRAVIRAFALVLPLLTTVPAAAQRPERVHRFQAGAPHAPFHSAAPRWEDPTFTEVFWGSVVGWGAGVAVLYGAATTGVCWEGCPDWAGALLFSPLAVLPALGAHAGSDRTGNVWVTLAVSTATLGLGWLVRDALDGYGWVPFTALHLSATTVAELATARRNNER